jgi:hypothetical protein
VDVLPFAPIIAGLIVIVWALVRLATSGSHWRYQVSDAGVNIQKNGKTMKYLWADFESFSNPDGSYAQNYNGSQPLGRALQPAIEQAKFFTSPTFYLKLKKKHRWLPVVTLVTLQTETPVAGQIVELLNKHLPNKQLLGLQLHRNL